VQQVGRYLRYSGRAANVAAKAAYDPEPTSDVQAFKATLPANAEGDPIGDFGLKHRTGCPRCRPYGHEHAIVTEVTDAAA
jgi:hypothetical protein